MEIQELYKERDEVERGSDTPDHKKENRRPQSQHSTLYCGGNSALVKQSSPMPMLLSKPCTVAESHYPRH